MTIRSKLLIYYFVMCNYTVIWSLFPQVEVGQLMIRCSHILQCFETVGWQACKNRLKLSQRLSFIDESNLS